MVGCAIVIPCLQKDFKYKLNDNFSLYTAETIIKAMDLTLIKGWASINICTDSSSVLTKTKFDLSRKFPFTRSNISPTMSDLLLKINKLINSNINIRFTWCPAHKGIKGNELVDNSAKSASYSGVEINNLVSYKELHNTLGRIQKYRFVIHKFH